MNSILTFITAILSSGIVASIISVSLSDEKERRIFRRTKIEEIYISTATWLKALGKHYIGHVSLANGRITLKQLRELAVNNHDKEIGKYHLNMQMNIKMYEPSIANFLSAVDREREAVNEIISKLINSIEKNQDLSRYPVELNRALDKFDAAASALTAIIIARGAEIGNETGQLTKLFGGASKWANATFGAPIGKFLNRPKN